MILAPVSWMVTGGQCPSSDGILCRSSGSQVSVLGPSCEPLPIQGAHEPWLQTRPPSSPSSVPWHITVERELQARPDTSSQHWCPQPHCTNMSQSELPSPRSHHTLSLFPCGRCFSFSVTLEASPTPLSFISHVCSVRK